MKSQRMRVKRRTAKKGAFNTLFANVARKKKKRHRAATAATSAELEGDVPNLGIARALVVILVIHVVAIGGIFFHSQWLDREQSAAAAGDSTTVNEEPNDTDGPLADMNLPRISNDEFLYKVRAGETYQTIATRLQIDEASLRKANSDRETLDGATYIRVPNKKVVQPEPVIANVEPIETDVPPRANIIPTSPDMVETEAARIADGVTTVTTSDGKTSYKVQPGDTFWAIAQKHGATVERLMEVNGIDDPKRLRAGMKLVIPD